MRSIFFVGALMSMILLPVSASAAEPPDKVLEDPSALDWRWRRHHWLDYVATGAMTTTWLISDFAIPHEDTEQRRPGGVVLDNTVRDAVVLESYDARKAVGRVSDLSVLALISYPTFFDVMVLAWALNENIDTAWQIQAINLQSFAFTSAFTSVVKHTINRERPSGRACRTDPTYDRRCEDQNPDLSFYSGHSAMAFTAAGLTCSHHLNMPLIGGGGDILACVGTTFVAATVGFERILADRHFLTDVLTGAAVGSASGLLLPWALHYAHPEGPPESAQWIPTPMPLPNGAGVGLSGIW